MMREKKEINIQIGERIKSARENAKLTQEALAERIEVSPQYVSDAERGVVGVSIATLKKICVTLGCSGDFLLFGEVQDDNLTAIAEKCRELTGKQISCLCQIVETYIEAVSP